jgi:hypothetical protein
MQSNEIALNLPPGHLRDIVIPISVMGWQDRIPPDKHTDKQHYENSQGFSKCAGRIFPKG